MIFERSFDVNLVLSFNFPLIFILLFIEQLATYCIIISILLCNDNTYTQNTRETHTRERLDMAK